MHFQGVLIYVDDPRQTAAFYEEAFGLGVRFIAPGDSYVELTTEEGTTLGFASRAFAGLKSQDGSSKPSSANFNVTLRVDDVDAAHARALRAGAASVAEPQSKPWGQTTALVLDCNGFLVELGTAWSGSK